MKEAIKELLKNGYLYFIITGSFLIAVPIWLVVIAPYLKKLPSNFYYTADIFSFDNFYNSKLKRFEGQKISKTIFRYDTIARNKKMQTIRVIFDVKGLNDAPIFFVSRLYYIDPFNYQHVSFADVKRNGYLFAPRYVGKKDFYYWHVNYNAPAKLKFVDKAEINGLTVYHYRANYSADQSENLSHLPGVPQKRGIKVDVNLNLWIEPISGWLVKYQDNTLAYYYDRQTGKITEPWNKFTNRYTQNSINTQIKQATFLKWKILFIDFGIPGIFILISLIFFLFGCSQRAWVGYKLSMIGFLDQMDNYIFYVFIVLLIFIGSLEVSYVFYSLKSQPRTFYIGVSQWKDDPELAEAFRGFKEGLAENGFREDKNIQFIILSPQANLEQQVDVLQEFVSKPVNLIYVQTTSGALIAKGITEKIPIVFSIVTYPEELNIISSHRSSKNNLVGVKDYLPAANQFYFFERIYPNIKRLGFVRYQGEPDSEIQLQEYKQILDKRNIQLIDIAILDFDHLSQFLKKPINYDALFVSCDSQLQGQSERLIADFAKRNKIPSLGCNKSGVINGLLVGYVADFNANGKIAGKKAALILRGAEPYWLQTEAPKKGILIINMETARLLGIVIPDDLLQKTDYLIGE